MISMSEEEKEMMGGEEGREKGREGGILVVCEGEGEGKGREGIDGCSYLLLKLFLHALEFSKVGK